MRFFVTVTVRGLVGEAPGGETYARAALVRKKKMRISLAQPATGCTARICIKAFLRGERAYNSHLLKP